MAEQDLKAAYIFNFIQFIEWPEKQGSGNEFTVCVSPFSPLKRSLTALENKQTTRGQTIKIRHLEAATLRECEALIVHNPDAEHVLRALRAAPPGHGVLTIADDMTFRGPRHRDRAGAIRRALGVPHPRPKRPPRPASPSVPGCCAWPKAP